VAGMRGFPGGIFFLISSHSGPLDHDDHSRLSSSLGAHYNFDVPSSRVNTETRMRRVVFALLALTTTAHAQAVVFTFDQWARLSAGLQEIYISGAVDSVFTIATPASAGTAKFYNDCVVKNGIKAHDLVEQMKSIVQTRPELYPKPATGALLAAMIKLCGQPVPE
jgi:hypothetical protein